MGRDSERGFCVILVSFWMDEVRLEANLAGWSSWLHIIEEG